MTKEEYLQWKQERGEPGTWDLAKCREADQLIKDVTMASVERQLRSLITNDKVRSFTYDMITGYFGCVEVDQLCMHLKAYPEWM